MTQTPIFDGHNDFLLRLLDDPLNREHIWLEGEGKGHLDLPRMQKSGFVGGFFAIYLPSPPTENDPGFSALAKSKPPYDLPLPPMLTAPETQHTALAMAGHLKWMERVSNGQFKVCHTAQEIRSCIDNGIVAAIMHMEGAEAIDEDLDALHLFYAMGLRSLGPVWSRPTIFGHGVPFRFPSDPDTGPGLTDAGKALIKECNALKILIDLSHMNEKGFDDVAKLSNAPLVATHSNSNVVAASARNLTDRQLDVIRESKGMVGLNFGTAFLRPDGKNGTDMDWTPMLQHLDHLIGRLGEDHVGFGSDFDGTSVPDPIGDVLGVPKLLDQMRTHGYGEDLVEKIAYRNWLGVLERTWGA